jgi:hypothetical protein
MNETIKPWIKDKSILDLAKIRAPWQWLIENQKEIVLVTCFGDLFLLGQRDEVNWLDTGTGSLTRVADDLDHFESLLENPELCESWFLPDLFAELERAGVELREDEVFSFKQMPILGGDHAIDNITVLNLLMHFQLSGLICEQTKDLPNAEGVRVSGVN